MTSSGDYPRWGENKPSTILENSGLQLSTFAEMNQNSSSKFVLYWVDANESDLAGFVCERRSK